jgi:hypothetical protein
MVGNKIPRTLGCLARIAGHTQLLEIRSSLFCKKVPILLAIQPAVPAGHTIKGGSATRNPRYSHSTHLDATLHPVAAALHPDPGQRGFDDRHPLLALVRPG